MKSRTVLMSGNMADPQTELIAAEIKDLGGEVLLFDETIMPYTLRATLEQEAGDPREGEILYRGTPLEAKSCCGAYVRHVDSQAWELPEGMNESREPYVVSWIAYIRRVVDHLVDGPVANPLDASVSNFFKPLQSAILEDHGFMLPRSMSTTDPEAARAFIEELGGDVIVKSCSGVRSKVRMVGEKDMERLEYLRSSPTLFQERLEGTDIRVHVVGSYVSALAILSPGVDYRYAGRFVMRPLQLPDEIAQQCIDVTRTLGLHFSGIDLMYTKEGYYAFEVNPDPGFSWFQQWSGVRISRAVAQYLLGMAS